MVKTFWAAAGAAHRATAATTTNAVLRYFIRFIACLLDRDDAA